MKRIFSLLAVIMSFAVVFVALAGARSPDAENSFNLVSVKKQTPRIGREEIKVFAQTEVCEILNAQRNHAILAGAESNNSRKSFVGLECEKVNQIKKVETYESPPLVIFNGFGFDNNPRGKI